MYYSMLKFTPAYYSVSVEMLKQSWRCRNIAVGVEALFTIETLKHIENNSLVEIATMFNLCEISFWPRYMWEGEIVR